jgi:hypothetical protein
VRRHHDEFESVFFGIVDDFAIRFAPDNVSDGVYPPFVSLLSCLADDSVPFLFEGINLVASNL